MKKLNIILVVLSTLFAFTSYAQSILDDDARITFQTFKKEGQPVTTKTFFKEQDYENIKASLKDKYDTAIKNDANHWFVMFSQVVNITTVKSDKTSCQRIEKLVVRSSHVASNWQVGFIQYIGDYHWLKKDHDLSNVSLLETYICY
jgi:hypothetical protein